MRIDPPEPLCHVCKRLERMRDRPLLRSRFTASLDVGLKISTDFIEWNQLYSFVKLSWKTVLCICTTAGTQEWEQSRVSQ